MASLLSPKSPKVKEVAPAATSITSDTVDTSLVDAQKKQKLKYGFASTKGSITGQTFGV